jgi:hypothetical protein
MAEQMGASSPRLVPIGRAPQRGCASRALAHLGRVTRWRRATRSPKDERLVDSAPTNRVSPGTTRSVHAAPSDLRPCHATRVVPPRARLLRLDLCPASTFASADSMPCLIPSPLVSEPEVSSLSLPTNPPPRSPPRLSLSPLLSLPRSSPKAPSPCSS